MSSRARRAVAAFSVVVFVILYVWLALAIADRLPDAWWIDLIFYAVVGTAWALPLKPLVDWAERSRGH